MRDEIPDTYKIKTLQNKILEIVTYFDEFCKENEITYFLMGGSALGAVRHAGFIPWDDDFDVFMDYENYNKLLCSANKIDKKRFYLQKEDTYENPYYFSKIRMNGTTFLDEHTKKDRDVHRGIYIDIMCLYNVPSSKLKQKCQYYAAALLKTKALVINGYKTNSIKKKVLILLANIVVNKYTKKVIFNIVKKYSNENTNYLGHFFGRAKLKNAVYPKRCFKEQKFINFEKIKLPVPCGVDEYLTIRYGSDYMSLPNEETKKIYQSHCTFWDVNKDYKEYVKNEKI